MAVPPLHRTPLPNAFFIGSSNVIGDGTSHGINGKCAGSGGVDRADDPNRLWSAFASHLR